MWPKMPITAHTLYWKSAKFCSAVTKVEEKQILRYIKKKKINTEIVYPPMVRIFMLRFSRECRNFYS